MKKETIMEQFLRIARARLRKIYRNKQQRRAWAAKMYSRWQQRKLKRLSDIEYDEDKDMYI
tara:strand:- start:657 stop:839 length:183 start_codon:yes stop_codon:yes gene_type:complete